MLKESERMRQCFKKKKAQSLAVVPYYCVYNICIYETGGALTYLSVTTSVTWMWIVCRKLHGAFL